MQGEALGLLRPAKTLEEIHKTLSPRPLGTPEELHAFYGKKLNAVRGSDVVEEMALLLRRTHGALFFKAFLMGRSGVGKSTEITRLLQMVDTQYRPIRFSALSDLDPGSFKPFDVLLLMMVLVAEETEKRVGSTPPDGLLQRIWQWYAAETSTSTQTGGGSVTAGAGVRPTADSWWGKFLGLSASIKGEIKYAADRKREVVEYRLIRIAELVGLANALLDECNRLLQTAERREWLFVGEEFDKVNRTELADDLFVRYGTILQELHTHFLFNLPVSLWHSDRGASLPRLSVDPMLIPDTPVFQPDHTPHDAGRDALREILAVRVRPGLFQDDLMTRLIVASGGNLRDLFGLVTMAALKAEVRKAGPRAITAEDADKAIQGLRQTYQGRLGDSEYSEARFTYEERAQCILDTYNQKPGCDIHTPVLHSLLKAGAVQEFNGRHWHGVHPLVVDIFNEHGRLAAPGEQPGPGGTK